MRRIFWGVCRNWFFMSPLHYLSSRSDFGFKFAEIFVFEKRLPAIADTGSRRLRVSVIGESPTLCISDRGSCWLPTSLIHVVANSSHHWYAESATHRITDTESQLLNFLKGNSLYRWYGESSTPRTSDTVSCRLPISLSRRVADSAYHRYGESTPPRIVESGSQRLCGSVIRGVTIQRKN